MKNSDTFFQVLLTKKQLLHTLVVQLKALVHDQLQHGDQIVAFSVIPYGAVAAVTNAFGHLIGDPEIKSRTMP